ncbi:sensor histidine kinase [Butyrivibrio sp. MC2013]|uniref:sensor histidine kinase n=1 Tax=Butyrivibrio sp. MC2013 TaxID=1280686 RepID=UPI0004057C45|nr:HAMP domain-containing sensor histidine kinase [Butyrivibrio sp. MC2013]
MTASGAKRNYRVKHPLFRDYMIIMVLLIIAMVGGILLLNSTLLEKYYTADKTKVLKRAYFSVEEAVSNGDVRSDDFNIELMKICESYNIDVIVVDADSNVVKSSSPDYRYLQKKLWSNLLEMDDSSRKSLIDKTDNYTIQIDTDDRTATEYMDMYGFLDEDHVFMIRSAMEGIKNSVEISNRFTAYIGLGVIVLGAVLSFALARGVTRPVMELASISENMKNLNFETKYKSRGRSEMDLLGENINEMSMTLENTISELKTTNIRLQNELDNMNKLEAMRSDFIAGVSHELKTPLSLISGYAEGLLDGVNEGDPEGMKFYCEVISDEASKMNSMVKQLLDLNELEFGHGDIEMERFDISELVQNYLKSADILTRNKNIRLIFEPLEPVYVWADAFRTQEVLQNYYTNAVNHAEGDKIVEIRIQKHDGRARISVFNSGKPIPEESIDRIWEKFYKVDKARSREYGGSGVGLSIVRAIMDAMGQDYGVVNYDNGVEFYFELETR